ncbi:MAG: hypothetical protein NC180_06460 [Muribaculaceae bacterium]|nr:hypothetical protein [Roseburia sp.]MCM1492850.1 hypothetical protein [Muribaculaceae bacterium]
MRLIVKEYIYQLKEKEELDILLSQIFVQKGYIADNQPKTGNRQYGVDIQLHNDEELLMLVVKQGNIDREIWDGSINAIRQSLDEIKDVIINSLTFQEKEKSIRIIVATNGQREESIKLNWNNYVNNNREWNGIPVTIEFMGIDDIVREILDNFFNEYLFDASLHSAMRKALYFIGEGDYKREYYEKIVDSLIANLKDSRKKKFDKICAALSLASQMVCQYAYDNGNNKISIMVSEYVIIKYWKYIVENNALGKPKCIEWLLKFCKSYEKWNDIYVAKIRKIADKEIILPNYNVVENRVLLYEILGYIASYGNYLLDVNPEKAKNNLNIIVELINEYSHFDYVPYDSNIGIIIMIYKIFYYYDRIDEIKILMENQACNLMNYYRSQHKFPTPTDCFEDAVKIEESIGTINYEVSAFWGYYLLLIEQLSCKELYKSIKEFLKNELKSVTKCVWFLKKEEELLFYEPLAMNMAGEGIEITIEKAFEDFSAKVQFIMKQYEKDIFSFDEYSFKSLEVIICHYFGYIPRVKFELE